MNERFGSDFYDDEARQMAEGLVEAEQRILAEKRRREHCACKEGMFPHPSRRELLRGAAALAGGSSLALLAGGARAEAPAGAVAYEVPEDPTKVQGRLTGDDGGYGTRSQFETEVRWRFPTATRESSWTMTPLEHGRGVITPSGLHFERHHGGIPVIDPARHTLIVHGMVERPKKYTMADLERFPSVSRMHFIDARATG